MRFSALQRAENSSIRDKTRADVGFRSFSALQRAENSSITRASPRNTYGYTPFQCSSASRKFLNRGAISISGGAYEVSVLFSEPKIPQSLRMTSKRKFRSRFSALQRAENSSINHQIAVFVAYNVKFQCSSASRKFLN